jgi:signal transduction histidine kinase
MFPGLSWELTYIFGNAARVIAGLLILLMLNDEFPGLIQKIAKRIFIVIYAAFCIFFLFAGTMLISRTIIVAEILLVVMFVYLAIRFILLARDRAWRQTLQTEHVFTLIGAAIVLAAFLHDALYYNGVHIMSYEIADVGVLALVLFQTAAMFNGTMRRYSEARREAEIARREAEELSAKTDFYRKMSHNLRTPLTRVSTNIQVVKNHPQMADAFLEEAQAEIMDMAKMIGDALEESDVYDGRGAPDETNKEDGA